MTEGYKTDKEAIASNASEKTGSSITHIKLVSLVALVRPPNIYHYLGQASVPLFAAIQRRQPTQPLSFLSSWLVLVLPLLLSMTLFANHPIILLALCSVPTRLHYFFHPCPKWDPSSFAPTSSLVNLDDYQLGPDPPSARTDYVPSPYYAHDFSLHPRSGFPTISVKPCEMRNPWSFFV